MRKVVSEQKIIYLAPVFLVLLVFFIPISSTMKSIFLVLTLIVLVCTPYYRHYLAYTYGTLWSYAALILFLYVVMACFWSEAPLVMRCNSIEKYSKLLFFPILAVGFIRLQTRKWVLNSYIVVIFLTCILSLLKAKHLLILNNNDAGEVFYNYIATGYMIALGVYFAGFHAIEAGLKKWTGIWYGLVVLLGSYQVLFINEGKTGYFVYVILMNALILQTMRFKKALVGIVLLCCALVFAFALSPVMQLRAQSLLQEIKLLQQHQQDSSLGFRIQFHQYALTLFKEHPIIGIGTGGFQYRFAKDQPIPSWGKKLNEPHSQYWLTLAEQGVIGIVLLFFFLGSVFLSALRLTKTKPIIFGTLVSFCLLSFSDTVFCYSPVGYLLILFTALCFGELVENQFNSGMLKTSTASKIS